MGIREEKLDEDEKSIKKEGAYSLAAASCTCLGIWPRLRCNE
jgi:hypothetical protein